MIPCGAAYAVCQIYKVTPSQPTGKNKTSNIEQFINDSMGVADLNKDDKINKLIEAMTKVYNEEGELEAFSK